MSKHVFISHAHKDSAAATAVVAALEERKVPCWIAPRDVSPGGSYAEAILTAIEGASCFVLIYSEHSNVSSHVLREVERALKFGVNIVPVRFDDSTPSKSLDYLLATVHWLAIPAESRERSIARAAQQIAEWLTNFLKDPATPLPTRMSSLENALVTSLAPPRKPNRLLVSAMVMAVLVAAGIFAADRLPFFPKADKSDTAASTIQPTAIPPSAFAPVEPSPATNRRAAAKAKPQIGYAGVDDPQNGRALPPPHNNMLNQPPPPFPDARMQNPAGNYGPPPPPPPPGGPNSEGGFGNGPGPGGPGAAGRFPPPPGGPMSGPPNGPPGGPPRPGGPRP